MYICCGAIVIFASIWLFIGNFINYRLLERERKQKETYKCAKTEDPDKDEDQAAVDTEVASEELFEKEEEAMQRETNI